MKAAIAVLGQAEVSEGGRKIAVLGDMLELGAMAEQQHEKLASVLSDKDIDLVFTTGQYMSSLWDALPQPIRGGHAFTADKLSPLVRSVVRPGDVVMVKGSLGSQTGKIVNDLLHLADRRDGDAATVVNGN